MAYAVREGLVTRDIKGVYFVIDIHDRHFYRNKQVTCVNRIAYEVMNVINEMDTFDLETVADKLLPLFNEETRPSRETLIEDVKAFIDVLLQRGWVYVR